MPQLKTLRHQRYGLTFIEMVVASAVIVMLIGVSTSLCFRVSQVWVDVRQHRVAMAELSNHMDQLTRMNIDEVNLVLDTLQASELSSRTLPEPQLSAQLVESKLGSRIILELNWKRRFPGPPVQLSGWIPPVPKESVDE